jgi:hypothetical protein
MGGRAKRVERLALYLVNKEQVSTPSLPIVLLNHEVVERI